MPPEEPPALVCKRCGTSAGLRSHGAGCLVCLLEGGLEEADPAEEESGSDPGSARVYQHYEILLRGDGSLHELGRGAMGVTYKAVDVTLRMPVALKVITPRFSDRADAQARFLREARSAARLRHPNVASVFHFGVTDPESGACFYAMEFVNGETLEARLRREGALPPAPALEIALQVTRALMAAEQRGLVHRDLKPANIMLVADHAPAARRAGEAWVKVIDFGLAKAAALPGADDGSVDGAATETHGVFVGTPQFASPEQFAGAAAVDVRSDIFSLGVTLWYLLTGFLPFEGQSLAEMNDRRSHRPLPIALLDDARTPAPLVSLLESMLAADPARRPASAEALHGALEGCLRALAPAASPPPGPAPGGKRRLLLAGAAALLLGLIAGVLYLTFSRNQPAPLAEKPAPTASAPDLDKSIAVLPLANLSEDKNDAFFTDGIQDDVLASLARIQDLKVIGRSSVAKYKAGEPRDLAAIGEQLGVAHVLEGGVRRTGDRVIVNVSLIDARDGRQRWGERYERTLANATALQGELASDIARELRVRLSPEETASVSTHPTDNARAYELYLRARDYDGRPGFLLINNQQAMQLYSQAIELDPRFALARARLAILMSALYANDALPAGEKDHIRTEVEEALKTQPNLGEAHLAQALFLTYVNHDNEGALREMAIAARTLPNDGSVAFYSAAIHRQQGRMSEVMADYEKALRQTPRNSRLTTALAKAAASLRDWPRATQATERTLELEPELPLARMDLGYIAFWRSGDLTPLRRALAATPPGVDPSGSVSIARFDLALLERDVAAAARALASCPGDAGYGFADYSKDYLQGCIALMTGDKERARRSFESARPGLEASTTPNTEDAYYHAALAQLYSYLDRHEDAIREARRACEIFPLSKDAHRGPIMLVNLAMAYARAGDADRALFLIEKLLAMPVTMDRSPISISRHDLRMRWQWDALRANPRFQKLVTGPEPKIDPQPSDFPLP